MEHASPPPWALDNEAPRCSLCTVRFGILLRRHHCRACGQVFCHQCTLNRIRLPEFDIQTLVRVCMRCYKERGIEEICDSENFTARYFLRLKIGYSLVSPLFDSCRRNANEKSMFLVRSDQGEELILTQISKGPLCNVSFSKSESAKDIFKKIIFGIKHPYILPFEDCNFVQNGEKVIFLSKFCKKGSLRDYMHRSNPKSIYGNKYKSQSISPLSFHEISIFGRQILEALIYLKERKFKILHLHSGNVLIENNVCYLSGVVENELLGIKPFINFDFDFDFDFDSDSSIVNHGFEVFSFGRVLYEMCTGKTFTKMDQMKPGFEKMDRNIPPDISEILSFIFFPKSKNHVTLEKIMSFSIFSNVKLLADVAFIHQNAFDSKCIKLINRASDVQFLETLYSNKKNGKILLRFFFKNDNENDNKSTSKGKSKSLKEESNSVGTEKKNGVEKTHRLKQKNEKKETFSRLEEGEKGDSGEERESEEGEAREGEAREAREDGNLKQEKKNVSELLNSNLNSSMSSVLRSIKSPSSIKLRQTNSKWK